MKLPQYAIALLITGFMSAIFSGQANAKNGELSMPKELVGIWGDDEMCIAYHRNDLYYISRKRYSRNYLYISTAISRNANLAK